MRRKFIVQFKFTFFVFFALGFCFLVVFYNGAHIWSGNISHSLLYWSKNITVSNLSTNLNDSSSWWYARIEHDLAPFKDGISKLMIENATKYPHILLYIDFFSEISRELPDMEFVWNMLDEPRVFKNFCENTTDWVTCACNKNFSGELTHGFLLRDPVSNRVVSKDNKWTPINELLPIFSASTITECFSDILIPSHLHMGNDYVNRQPKDGIVWEARKFKAFWRGSTTGGVYNNKSAHYSLFHRQRLVAYCRTIENCDARFANYIQCDQREICDEMRSVYGPEEHVPLGQQFFNKIILDIDGNTYRVYKENGTCVFKLSLFEDFATIHTQPWVHYVPVKMDLSDLKEKLLWAKKHDDEIKRIAENGKEHVYKYFNFENFKNYTVHLLKKYHSLLIK